MTTEQAAILSLLRKQGPQTDFGLHELYMGKKKGVYGYTLPWIENVVAVREELAELGVIKQRDGRWIALSPQEASSAASGAAIRSRERELKEEREQRGKEGPQSLF